MKWNIAVELRVSAATDPDEFEVALGGFMDALVAIGAEDPAVGASLADRVATIEFVVDADDLIRARAISQEVWDAMIAKATVPPDVELVAESTRRAELVSA
jgi:hypothetical protein